MAQALGHFNKKEVTHSMAKKKSDDEAPSTEYDGPFNRIKDVVAGGGDASGGPVNPVRNADPNYAEEESGTRNRFPWEADPTADADDSSASTIALVNEAREAGTPLNEKDDTRPVGDAPAGDPAGTGVSAPVTGV